MNRRHFFAAVGVVVAGFVASARADQASPAPQADAKAINIAVAANFAEPAKEIAALFKQKTGSEAILSFGASGEFFTPDLARRALSGVPVGRSGAAQGRGRAGLRRARDRVHLRHRQARAVEQGRRRGRRRRGAEGRQVRKTVDRQSRRRTLRRRRDRDDEGARRLRRDPAEDRPGREHRPGVSVRGHQERRARFRRALAAQGRGRRARAGSCRRTSTPRSGRTPRCSRRARTARPRKPSSSS